MTLPFNRRFSILLLLCAGLPGCDKPQLRSVVEEKEAVSEVAPALVPAAVTEPAPQSPTAPAAAAAEPREMEEPLFRIWRADKKITIKGALKSRIQVDRIVAGMTGAFPDDEIVNELKVEAHRFPVAWGNRLVDEFLIPYFKEVKSPGVSYEAGIITLLGEAESGARHRVLTEIAIITFAGELTQNIDNKITTGK